MQTFNASDPITLHAEFPAGDLIVVTTDRQDATIEVLPSRKREADVAYAREVTVEQVGDTIRVVAPDVSWLRRTPSIEVRVSMPAHSHLRARTASADITARGPLGEVTVTTASGDVAMSHAATLTAKSASGDIKVDVIDDGADVNNTSGDIRLVTAGGPLQLTTASGSMHVSKAASEIRAKSASGDLRVDQASSGRITAQTASGDMEIAVTRGTAAWLDVSSISGKVRSDLTQGEDPGPEERTIEISARSLSGDITIRRTELSR
ncbi:DUF4097 domain-containing protein [Nonomuraea sp. NBC_01738]|uniref:DUF4097 family beta strand repeat-containing protein n=1 Tax=Nonomuraea sp. NBC_01738 TaxID=2976003 RepID=UPI002E0E4048|nr:DUF4097 domain-containing protein [Nonomuraea sp. NBC_01738]